MRTADSLADVALDRRARGILAGDPERQLPAQSRSNDFAPHGRSRSRVGVAESLKTVMGHMRDDRVDYSLR